MFLGAYHKIFKSDVNERRTIEISRDVRLIFKKQRTIHQQKNNKQLLLYYNFIFVFIMLYNRVSPIL